MKVADGCRQPWLWSFEVRGFSNEKGCWVVWLGECEGDRGCWFIGKRRKSEETRWRKRAAEKVAPLVVILWWFLIMREREREKDEEGDGFFGELERKEE